MTQIVIALEDELLQALENVSRRSQIQQEKIISQALLKHLAWLDEEHDPLIG